MAKRTTARQSAYGRARKRRQAPWWAFGVGIFLLVVGLLTAGGSHRALVDAQGLWDTGRWTTAHDAEVRVEEHGFRSRYTDVQVTAVVDYPSGTRRVPLLHADTDVDDLPREVWVPVGSGTYAGTFDVVYDSDRPGRVMESGDAAYLDMYGEGDRTISLWIAVAGLVVTGLSLPFVRRVARPASVRPRRPG